MYLAFCQESSVQESWDADIASFQEQNQEEGAIVRDMKVIGVENLREMIEALKRPEIFCWQKFSQKWRTFRYRREKKCGLYGYLWP